MDIEEECKGCRTLNRKCCFVHNKMSRKYFINDKIKLECPCSKCLIKGVCKIECDAFIQFGIVSIEKIKRFRNEE